MNFTEGLNIYIKGDYEEMKMIWTRKNKANSKPICYRSAFCVQLTALLFRHSCENRNPELLMVLDSASSAE